jgi:hypothetical protein
VATLARTRHPVPDAEVRAAVRADRTTLTNDRASVRSANPRVNAVAVEAPSPGTQPTPPPNRPSFALAGRAVTLRRIAAVDPSARDGWMVFALGSFVLRSIVGRGVDSGQFACVLRAEPPWSRDPAPSALRSLARPRCLLILDVTLRLRCPHGDPGVRPGDRRLRAAIEEGASECDARWARHGRWTTCAGSQDLGRLLRTLLTRSWFESRPVRCALRSSAASTRGLTASRRLRNWPRTGESPSTGRVPRASPS